MAVVMLADQGKLSLDDDVQLHLPELKVGQAVTLRQMLRANRLGHDLASWANSCAASCAAPCLPAISRSFSGALLRQSAHFDQFRNSVGQLAKADRFDKMRVAADLRRWVQPASCRGLETHPGN